MMEDNERQSHDQDNQNEFGLPEVEYKPIEREEEESPAYEQDDHYYKEENDENPKRSGLIIFGIVGLLFVLGFMVYLFFFGGTEHIGSWFGDDEPVPQSTYVEPEPEPLPEVKEETQPTETTTNDIDPLAPYSDVSTISQPIGRSFIVIGSFVDEDLALDYADKMKDQGIFVKILSPTDRAPLMHRVVVADYPEFGDAMQQVPQFREKYGDNSWVLKY